MAAGVMTLSLLATSAMPLVALAREDEGTTEQRAAPVVDVACMKTAITKREDAVASAVDAYNTAMKSAYAARKTALLAAWDKTDVKERRTAKREARKAFKESAKAARETLHEARKTAWDAFAADAKACGGKPTDEGSAREDQGVTI